MASTTQLVTAYELLQMPDDGVRYELIQGELRKMSPSGSEHGKIAGSITISLGGHVRAHQLGTIYAAETGYQLTHNPDTILAPDVSFIRRERVEAAGTVRGYWQGAPDLAVEVISPGDTYSEVEDKATAWLEAGTRMVLVVNPRKHTVTVYRSLTEIAILTENDTLDASDVIAGWKIAIKEIFE